MRIYDVGRGSLFGAIVIRADRFMGTGEMIFLNSWCEIEVIAFP